MAALALLGLAGCAGPVPAPAERSAGSPTDGDWPDAGGLMLRLPAPDRTVAITLSDVVRNRNGLLVRVLSVTDVWDTGKQYPGATQGCQEVSISTSGKCGAASSGRMTFVHPRDGLTWGDVRDEGDLVLETEAKTTARSEDGPSPAGDLVLSAEWTARNRKIAVTLGRITTPAKEARVCVTLTNDWTGFVRTPRAMHETADLEADATCPVTCSDAAHTTDLRPADGLTWGQVRSKLDLVLRTEDS